MITIHCNEPSHPKSIVEIEIATFTPTITYATADSVEALDGPTYGLERHK